MLKAARNGYLLFSQPINSLTSWVVMYFQGGPGSHVGTLTDNGTVLEAITTGVVEREASVYFDGKHYLAIGRHAQWDEEIGQKVVSFMRSQIGCGYAWGGVVSLGLHILIGNHWDWRPRISFDVLILLAFAWLAVHKFPLIQWMMLVVGVLYAAIVVIVRLRPHPALTETTLTGRGRP